MYPVLRDETQYFQHHPGGSCPHSKPETLEHLQVKERIAVTVDGLPRWRAEIEARGSDPVGGEDYIIDVAAIHDDEDRPPWAYEVQLSNQGAEKTQLRTEQRQRGHRAQVVWLNPRRRDWSTEFPSVVLGADQRQVVDGVYEDEDVPVAPLDLEVVVQRFHRDRYQWVTNYGFVDVRTYRGFSRPSSRRRKKPGGAEDRCDRVGESASGGVRVSADGLAFWRDWGDDEYFCYARQAHARREAGMPLDAIDHIVLARYPSRPSMFDLLPSQRTAAVSSAA